MKPARPAVTGVQNHGKIHSARDFLRRRGRARLACAQPRDYSSSMARPDCPHCEGSGWKVVEREAAGAQPMARAAEARAGASAGGTHGAEPRLVWAVPCDCTAADKPERALQRARVPERYRHCDFDNYETDNEHPGASAHEIAAYNRSLASAKLVVQRFAEEFLPVAEARTEHGLLLMGPCGVGKTHLAVAAMKTIVARGHSGLYYDYRELLKAIQDSYNPESQATEMGVLEPVLKAEILVLDDVGSSKPSPWALETVGHILNTRYNDKRVTLLTTNYLDTDASTVNLAGSTPGANTGSASSSSYGASRMPGSRSLTIEDSLSERVGRRIRSRLFEMCKTVTISALDYRQHFRPANFR